MATTKKAYYKHHERATDADAKSSMKTREVVLSTQGNKILAKTNAGLFLEWVTNWFRDSVSFASLAAAISDMGATEREFVVSTTVNVTANTVIPSNIHLRVVRGGSFNISAGITLTIDGPFSAPPIRVFSGNGSVVFGEDNGVAIIPLVQRVLPQWWGAAGDGLTDDTTALQKALAAAPSQYTGTGVYLGSQQYLFSSTLTIRKRVTGNGFRLIPSGDGSGFVAANYTATTAPSKVDCMIVIQDGGVLEGGSIVVIDASLDKLANQGKWLVNIEGNFGKNPFHNMRVNGLTSARYLGGVIVRYNTTCDIGPFGGAYLYNGLKVDASNICHFKGIFFEFLRRGGEPFLFTNSSNNTVNGLWCEGCASNLLPFHFNGVSNYRIRDLQVGDPDGGATLTGTSDAVADTITQDSDYILATNDRIRFDTAPGGVTTTDFLYVVNANASTFQVSLTSGGAAINITTSVAVTWRSALQNAVRFTSCDRMIGEALKIENGAAFVNGVTLVTGSSSRIMVDDTFFTTASAYGLYTEFQWTLPRPFWVKNVDLTDTTNREPIGQITKGARITFVLIAKTAGFSGTDGALNIYKLTGAGFTLKGTITPGSGDLTSQGAVKQLTYDLDETAVLYVAPVAPAGSGILDVLVSWNPVSGL